MKNNTSPAKLEANRKNAKRSTGPKTAAGKKAVARNAMKHGLTADEVVVVGEDTQHFTTLRNNLVDELNPTTTLEGQLVERIAINLWRLRRVPKIETEMFDGSYRRYEGIGSSFQTETEHLNTLLRYESSLERSTSRALHELQRLQAMRNGQAVSLPAALDVDVNVRADTAG